MTKKKIVIISQVQFGYHVPNYTYCKYLRKEFEITFICWDFNKRKISLDGINVVYVRRKGNFIFRSIRFIRTALNTIRSNDTLIFITYFKFVTTVLKFIKRENIFILDIRTGSVEKNQFSRFFYDMIMKFESKFFKHKAVLSKNLADKMKFNSDVYILPLGSEIISETEKVFDEMNLFYVGTFFNRRLEDTVTGFSNFYTAYKNKIKMKYTIIGRDVEGEEQVLKNQIKKLGLSHIIDMPGEMPHDDLKQYFDSHNIGVSYIPITDYYDSQPVLKTFEYLLSGMPVIATNTTENAAVINNSNGILIQDNPQSFYHGLVNIYERRKQYNSDYIKDSAKKYSWSKIVGNFNTYLKTL